MYKATNPITSKEALQARLDEMHPSQVNKIIDHIDDHCAAWIGRSPFIIVSTVDASGRMDVSPKGDPPGFVKVLDTKTLAIPDRIGNNRGDGFLNILETSRVGLLFVVPKRKEVLRVSGSAEIVMDEPLREMTEVNGHRPDLLLLVRVEEAFFHCGKSMIRSRMWQPEMWGPIDGLPTYAEALKDHGDMPDPLDSIEARMAYNESDRLY